jgi:hypothetical protein
MFLPDKEEFHAWREQKECERKRKIETEDYVAECLTGEEGYVLWQNHLIGTRKSKS